ncbi:hypothetical protein HHK36_016942 [Tetracentron sinense]|uniref:Neprosin PEP catalytic domain-containing protein n=1 Tax=Tetracentron sinense TaxID=13715 RepID=A0A834Z693_TETSI|nr:hypothetical protein HHK36_016942 [Tetracentron sinense]
MSSNPLRYAVTIDTIGRKALWQLEAGEAGVRGDGSKEAEEAICPFLICTKTSLRLVSGVRTEHGDIYDCVDINKQPALDHPLLNHHRIQMRPSSFPEGITREASSKEEDLEIELSNGGCSQGTVPIRRTRKEDLIKAKSFLNKHHPNIHLLTDTDSSFHFAQTLTTSEDTAYYGAQANINVYNPSVSQNQYSEALIWLSNGPPDRTNCIEVGWAVNPQFYGDNLTRLTSYWTVDGFKTGCVDTSCPGFVQTNPKKPLGIPIVPVSTYHGEQYIFKISVFQDNVSKNWWLVAGRDNAVIGYWPKSIFNTLSSYASQIVWAGDIYSPTSELIMPPMGSGHFPNEGYGGASFFKQIQVVKDNAFVDPDESTLETFTDKPNCYGVGGKSNEVHGPGYHFFFGGPGGICGTREVQSF